jgi:chromosome segregation ATPase
MIGPISGSSGSVSELKALLELVSDPKKVSAAIAQLEKVQVETGKLLEEKAELESKIEKESARVEKAAADLEDKIANFNASAVELASKLRGLEAGLRDVKAREERLAKEREAIDNAKAELAKDKAEHKLATEKSEERLAKKSQEAKALKDEYETKLSKLKQAMG